MGGVGLYGAMSVSAWRYRFEWGDFGKSGALVSVGRCRLLWGNVG